MKILSTKHEILNKFKIQNSQAGLFEYSDIRICLAFRNSNFGFTPERSA